MLSVALEVDTSFASRRVTLVLETIITERGRPLAIRCDNGPELSEVHHRGGRKGCGSFAAPSFHPVKRIAGYHPSEGRVHITCDRRFLRAA
jgi:hypothetical protein